MSTLKKFIFLILLLFINNVYCKGIYSTQNIRLSVFWIDNINIYNSLKKEYSQIGNAFYLMDKNNHCTVHSPRFKNEKDNLSMEYLGNAVAKCLGHEIKALEKSIDFKDRNFKSNTFDVFNFPLIEFILSDYKTIKQLYVGYLNHSNHGYKTYGFSGWTDSGFCHVYYKKGDIAILGHEVAHCLLGDFHYDKNYKLSNQNRKIIDNIRTQYSK